MPRVTRPLCLFVFLCGFAALTQSQPAPGGGYNLLIWQKDHPAATVGGVDLAVTIKPTTGWKCTEVTFRVIEDDSGKTLETKTIADPDPSVSWSCTGLKSNLKVRVTADATFQNQDDFNFKDLEEWVTTK